MSNGLFFLDRANEQSVRRTTRQFLGGSRIACCSATNDFVLDRARLVEKFHVSRCIAMIPKLHKSRLEPRSSPFSPYTRGNRKIRELPARESNYTDVHRVSPTRSVASLFPQRRRVGITRPRRCSCDGFNFRLRTHGSLNTLPLLPLII